MAEHENRNASEVDISLAEKLTEDAETTRSPATRRAYEADWRQFENWCAGQGRTALPADPETVALYFVEASARLKPASLNRKAAAITHVHRKAGHESPSQSQLVRTVLAGIRRKLGTTQTRKAPALAEHLKAMLALLPDSLRGKRDRALLLVGFAGAFRRSELVSVDVEDLELTTEGVIITLRRSKTDQEGRGASVAIPSGSSSRTCPVRALRSWLGAADIVTGPAFRPVDRFGRVGERRLCDRSVALVVKRLAEAAGLDPTLYAGHSLRAGFATQAAINGVANRVIMRQTRHRSHAVVERYVRDGRIFADNAASKVNH